jgi:uncharacterized Ntn-hydrolase superfamily protein
MTYSIVARDSQSGCLGVAVQSHFFGVGRLVTWAEAGVGAIATQAFAEVAYGPRGLALLRDGASATQALAELLAADPLPAVRQVAIVDADGQTAAHTGAGCVPAAGHAAIPGVSAQANMMERATVWDVMVDAYQTVRGSFAERMLGALDAAEREGGDIRGQQSAALLIVGPQRSASPWEEMRVDVRVDDHSQPLAELRRLVAYHDAYARLAQALFVPGAVIGDYDLGEPELDRALADLEDAQRVLGANPEPTFWRGALLARAGRTHEARAAFAQAAAQRPALAEFARRLPAAGILDADSVAGGSASLAAERAPE